ncbi:MAG: DUF2461 family protein [Polyangiaceae bacterium]
MPSFEGFGAASCSFFRGLEQSNTHEYFAQHQAEWQSAVEQPLLLLLEELAPKFGVGSKLFRPKRNPRYGAAGGPYKLMTYGVVGARSGSAIGSYVELSSRGLYAAAGYYEMTQEQLLRFRDARAEPSAGDALERTIANAVQRGLSVCGALRAAPGTKADAPRRPLRRSSLLAGARLAADVPELFQRAALDFVADTWQGAAPLGAWLDEHVGSNNPPKE